jgi:thioredoxin-related protein
MVQPALTATSQVHWFHDREAAFAEARKLRRPILIDVSQEDCGGCVKLDEVTFTDPAVVEEIASRFVALKLDLIGDREFTRAHQIFWTPTVLIADHSGKVRYTSVNYLPPAEMLDVLDIGEGMVAMRWKESARSIDAFKRVEDRRPDGPLTAEAIYWRGMATYFRDGKSPASAKGVWQAIKERFPDSIWALRQP